VAKHKHITVIFLSENELICVIVLLLHLFLSKRKIHHNQFATRMIYYRSANRFEQPALFLHSTSQPIFLNHLDDCSIPQDFLTFQFVSHFHVNYHLQVSMTTSHCHTSYNSSHTLSFSFNHWRLWLLNTRGDEKHMILD